MKHKLFTLLLGVIFICAIFSLTACNGNNNDNADVKHSEPIQGTDGLLYTLSDDGDYYICSGMGTATGSQIVIGDIFNNLPVKEIADRAFRGCYNLSGIIVGNNVVRIGSSAFEGCFSLKNITIGSGVSYIANKAFKDCFSLESITVDSENSIYKSDSNTIIAKATNTLILDCKNSVIPNYVTGIDLSYRDNYSFQNYTEKDNVIYLGNERNRFLVLYEVENRDITSLVVDSNCMFINNYAFSSYTLLETVTFGENSKLISIGSGAFQHCDSLEAIEIPNSVTSIGESVFAFCGSLKYNKKDNASYLGNENNPYLVLVQGEDNINVEIDSGCKIILDNAFAYCGQPKNILIPSSVIYIGMYAFSGCSSLESITFEDISTWYYRDEFESYETQIDVSNPTNNVLCFKAYKDKYWYKK